MFFRRDFSNRDLFVLNQYWFFTEIGALTTTTPHRITSVSLVLYPKFDMVTAGYSKYWMRTIYFQFIVVVMKHYCPSQFLQKKIKKYESVLDSRYFKNLTFSTFLSTLFYFSKKYTEIYSHSNFINISYSIINWIIFYLLIILLKKYIFLCLHLSLSLVYITFIRMEKRRRKNTWNNDEWMKKNIVIIINTNKCAKNDSLMSIMMK